MPTLIEIAGANYPASYRDKALPPLPGVSLLPLLRDESIERPDPIFFQWGYGRAVITPKWKLVSLKGGQWELYDRGTDPTLCEFKTAAWIDGHHMLRVKGPGKSTKTETITLYDLAADPDQENNIADSHPQDVERMFKELKTWRESVRSSFAGNDYIQ